jgi:hypothetical protein
MNSLMKGRPTRAVTFQSIERGSSPSDVFADLVEFDAAPAKHRDVAAGHHLRDEPLALHEDAAHFGQQLGELLVALGLVILLPYIGWRGRTAVHRLGFG